PTERSKQPLDDAPHVLFQIAGMNRTQPRWNLVASLEVLRIPRTSINRAHVGNWTHLYRLEVRWRHERFRGETACDAAHEIGPDRKGDARTRTTISYASGLIES